MVRRVAGIGRAPMTPRSLFLLLGQTHRWPPAIAAGQNPRRAAPLLSVPPPQAPLSPPPAPSSPHPGAGHPRKQSARRERTVLRTGLPGGAALGGGQPESTARCRRRCRREGRHTKAARAGRAEAGPGVCRSGLRCGRAAAADWPVPPPPARTMAPAGLKAAAAAPRAERGASVAAAAGQEPARRCPGAFW